MIWMVVERWCMDGRCIGKWDGVFVDFNVEIVVVKWIGKLGIYFDWCRIGVVEWYWVVWYIFYFLLF